MRSIWNGALRWGEIVIPVGLGVVRAREEISLQTLHRTCQRRIVRPATCPEHGEVAADELVKAWEVAPGQAVLFEEAELAAVGAYGSRVVELRALVDEGEIDSLIVDTPYYLIPSKSPVGTRAYALLASALQETGTAAIGRLFAWKAEHACAVMPLHDGRGLVLATLFAIDELRSSAEIKERLGQVALNAAEAELARELAERMKRRLDASLLVNESRTRLRQLIDAKIAGDEVVRLEPVTDGQGEQLPTPSDLAGALRRSIRATGRRRWRPQAAAKV